jgi:3-carboxy-cis,cis-muconate cycloisomerase
MRKRSSLSSDDAGLLTPGRSDAAGDAAYLAALLTAEAALTRAQAGLGLAPRTAADLVTAVASDLGGRLDPRGLAERARSGGNPVIPLVADLTAAVAEQDPEAAEYVHRGATSQDILDTATMLVAGGVLETVLADLSRTADRLATLAAEHRDTPMPGRTLTQQAVPTTFGLKAAGWRSLVLDARDRLAAVRLPVQLGGAAGTLAAFHAYAYEQDSADLGLRLIGAFARETGLAEPLLPWHTLRTPVADLAGALAFTAGALGKLAQDVLVMSRTEIAELAEGSGGGSSAMPHKSNPVRATLMAATARTVPALAAVLYGSLAAEDDRPAGAWHAEWQPFREALRQVSGAAENAAALTTGLTVNPDRMRANLDLTNGRILTEHLAAALSRTQGRSAAKDAAAASDSLPPHLSDPANYLGSAAALVDRALTDRTS